MLDLKVVTHVPSTAELTSGNSTTSRPDFLSSPPIDVFADDGVERRVIVENSSRDDFCVLAKPEATKTEVFHNKIRVAMQLFDILSENSVIDHPLCEECTRSLFVQLDEELRNLKKVKVLFSHDPDNYQPVAH